MQSIAVKLSDLACYLYISKDCSVRTFSYRRGL